jgi:hypothetical protein
MQRGRSSWLGVGESVSLLDIPVWDTPTVAL